MKPRQGLALLSALLIFALLLVFCFTIMHLASFHYRAVQIQQDRLQALEAAQAGLSETVRRLGSDPTFGRNGQTISGQVGQASYRVTFAPGDPQPWSLNNLEGLAPKDGFGTRRVAASTAQILSLGTTPSGERRTVEAVVRLDALPFAVQATGKVDGEGVTVAGFPSLASFIAGQGRLPGSVYAGASGGEAVHLKGLSQVTGEVRTVGQASLGPAVVVAGEVQENAEPLEVPDLRIGDFDNSTTPGVTVLSGGNYAVLVNPVQIGPGLPVTHVFRGPVYVDGSVTLTGPVFFNEAQIFVANGGDFVVHGQITGKGSLFVTGKTSFLGGTMLGNDDKIAIFSEKDLEITGGSFFQGVLYTRGKFSTVAGLTVLGAVISRGGSITLGLLSQVVHLPEYTAFASFWLGKSSQGAPVRLIYWAEVP